MKISRSVKGIGLFVLALITIWVVLEDVLFPAVPWQNMWVAYGDVGGAATFATPAFSIAFPGRSLSDHWSGGNYIVDGRYASDWNPTVFHNPSLQADGPDITYAPQHRTLSIMEYGHTFVYSSFQRQLQVDGKNWPLTSQPLHLTINPQGQVREITSPGYDAQLTGTFHSRGVIPATVQL